MSFFADIDVLIAPSEWAEPFGLTVVEAYRAGVPVLGTRSGGIAEVIGSVDSSWLVPPSDPEALSQSMTRLLQAGRGALPRPENFAAVLRRTAIDNVLDKYLHVYEMTLGGTGANPAREARIAV
jgi:glycosyltransferase involved in cell wall biosynthesis